MLKAPLRPERGAFKTCGSCKQSLPATLECFYRSGSGSHELQSYCILCCRNKSLKYRKGLKGLRYPEPVEAALERFKNDDISTAELARALRSKYGEQTIKVVNAARQQLGLPAVTMLV